jgi:hypothetical protein
LPKAASSVLAADLDQLCIRLTAEGLAVTKDYTASSSGPPKGLSWVELIVFYVGAKGVETLTVETIKYVARTVANRGRTWAEERLAETRSSKPHEIRVIGPDGQVLETIRIEPTGNRRIDT